MLYKNGGIWLPWKYVLSYFDFNGDILTGKCSPYMLISYLYGSRKPCQFGHPISRQQVEKLTTRPISTPALIHIYPYLALITLTKNVGKSIKRKENMK